MMISLVITYTIRDWRVVT